MTTLRNSIWLFFGKFAGVIISLITTILIAKLLGDAGFGMFAYLSATISIFSTITSFGTEVSLTRSIALSKSSSLEIGPALSLQLGLSLVLITFTFLTGEIWIQDSTALRTLFLFVFILFPTALNSTLLSSLKGLQKMHAFSMLLLSDQLIFLVGLLMLNEPSIQTIILLLTGSKLITSAIVIGYFRSAGLKVSLSKFLDRWELQGILTVGGWITMGVMLSMITQRASILFLERHAENQELGWFAFANRLVELLKLAPAAYYAALFPALVIARGDSSSPPVIPWKLFIFIGIGIILMFFLISPLITCFFSEYNPSISLFKILCIGLVPFLAKQYIAVQLLSMGNERVLFFSTSITFLISIPVFHFSTLYFQSLGLVWGINLLIVLELLLLMVFKSLSLLKH